MIDILQAFICVSGICATLMFVAAWFSPGMLDSASSIGQRFHDWFQLRIKARRAGLVAYRNAVKTVLGDSPICAHPDCRTIHEHRPLELQR